MTADCRSSNTAQSRACDLRRRATDTRVVERPHSEWISVSVPPIIDRETFDLSQARHDPNRQFSPRRLKEERWLLRRLLRCGKCGRKHSCVGANSKSSVAHYRCGKQDDPVERRCRPCHLRADLLDELVWKELCEKLLDLRLLIRAHGQINGGRPSDEAFLDQQVQSAQRRLSQAQAERGRLLDAYQGGFVSKKEFEERTRRLTDRVRGLEADVDKLKSERQSTIGDRQLITRIESFTRSVAEKLDRMTFHERQGLARKVLEEVVLDQGHLRLYFKIPLPAGDRKPADPDNESADTTAGSPSTSQELPHRSLSAGRPLSSRFGLRSRRDDAVKVNVQCQVRRRPMNDSHCRRMSLVRRAQSKLCFCLGFQPAKHRRLADVDDLGTQAGIVPEDVPQRRRAGRPWPGPRRSTPCPGRS
jgi:hypothetical protein